MNKEAFGRFAKKSGIILLSTFLFITAMMLLSLGAAAIPENNLTPLPYAWYMIGLRLLGYIAFYYFYRQHRFTPLIVAIFAACYEGYLFTLYQAAVEGVLW
ncbi:MAG: hypothetical protein ACRDBQ_06780 [Shewanella sp.]